MILEKTTLVMKRISYDKKLEKGQVINTKNHPSESIDEKSFSRRIHCVSVRFNSKKIKIIDIKRGSTNKSVWLRK